MARHYFCREITVYHPETDEPYEIQYSGFYQPQTYKEPMDSRLEITSPPKELSEYEEKIIDNCWVDFHEREEDE